MTTILISFILFDENTAFAFEADLDPRELTDFQEAWRDEARMERSRGSEFGFYDYVELIGF